jgi:hypothetical protein
MRPREEDDTRTMNDTRPWTAVSMSTTRLPSPYFNDFSTTACVLVIAIVSPFLGCKVTTKGRKTQEKMQKKDKKALVGKKQPSKFA